MARFLLNIFGNWRIIEVLIVNEKEYKPEGGLWFLVIFVSLVFAGSLYYFGQKEGIDQYQPANGSNGTQDQRQSRLYTVYYNTGVFSPTNLRIHAGDSVKFQNDSQDPLRVVSDVIDGIPDLIGFDSNGDVPPKGSFAFTFSKSGSFGYHNDLNKSERGMVIVRP